MNIFSSSFRISSSLFKKRMSLFQSTMHPKVRYLIKWFELIKQLNKFLSMKLFIGILTLISIISFSSDIVQADPKTEYYRHLVFRESPVSEHKGIYPISKQESKEVAHYRFSYDEDGRVTEISHRIGDDLIADNGNWDTFTWWASKLTVEYGDNNEIVTYFNRYDEISPALGRVTQSVYELDEQGRRIRMYFLNEGEPAENHWNVHRYEWEHKGNGTIIEKRFNLDDEPATLRPNLTFYTVELQYGDDDLLDFMFHIDEKGELVNNTLGAAIDRIVYDQHGNFSRWMVYDENRELAEGNDPQLALGENLYDEYGNKVVLRGYDVHMNPKAMPNGVGFVRRKYDSFGNLIEEAYRDINDNHIIRLNSVFSNDGRRMVAREFRDDSGRLENHPSLGFAREVILYTEAGRFIETQQYTAEGEMLEGGQS